MTPPEDREAQVGNEEFLHDVPMVCEPVDPEIAREPGDPEMVQEPGNLEIVFEPSKVKISGAKLPKTRLLSTT